MHEWQSLSHVRWDCKYHVVMIPKYRRKVFYGRLRRQIGVILRDLCRQRGVELVEGHAMPDHVHLCLSIPTQPDYGSLNLAQAVQLLAYDWRQALGGFPVVERTRAPAPADAAAVQGLLAHWREVLVRIGFLDPRVPKKLLPRLRQLVNRAQVTREEVHILRGIAREVDRVAAAAGERAGGAHDPE